MATYTWQSGSGDFNVASNWTLDTVPGPADEADFLSGTGTISGNFDVDKILIRLSQPPAGSPPPPPANWTFTGQSRVAESFDMQGGTITLASGASITETDGGLGIGVDNNSSGTFVVEPGATYTGAAPAGLVNFYLFNVGFAAGATGTAIIQGPGALVDTGFNGASVGYNPGSGGTPGATGSLQILAGGVAEFASPNSGLASLSVGRQGTGTVTVDGTGSRLQLSGYLAAARSGTGTVTLTNGATLTETAVPNDLVSFFGRGLVSDGVVSAGTGFLNVLSGSTATFADSLDFGLDGDTGIGLVSDGTLNVGGKLALGASILASGGKGTLTIEDGGVVRDTTAADPSSGYVLLGATADTTGTVGVDGWGSRLDAGANAIDVGAIGTGTLTASDHGLITSTGLTVGDQGNGTLNLTSGGAAITKPASGTEAALSVGAQSGGTGSISVSGYGSALIAEGEAVLGGTDASSGTAAGGTGDVSVSKGGLLGTGSMTIEAGSNLGIDGTSAAIVTGNLSDGGGVTTSVLLVVNGTMSGAGSLALDGGLANVGSLDSTNVTFDGAPAILRVQALNGTSSVSDMQVGDVVDLVGQHGVTLKDDTVMTQSGMLFLSPAPTGDAYQLVHSQDGTAVVLTTASGHGMSDMATDGLSATSLDDVSNISGDLLQRLGVNPGVLPSTVTDELVGASVGSSLNPAAVDLLMVHQPFAN